MTNDIEVGLLVSTAGTYKDIARSTLSGLRDAISEINDSNEFEFNIVAHTFDPAGQLENYISGANYLLEKGVKHIFGPTTSASRKEIIPDIERAQALLWYPCPYEGYECSENVLYMGGCPNQNLVPLMYYAIREFGSNAYLIGSNYVWGWESNRIARELVDVSGGTVINEKYYRFEHQNFTNLIDEIISNKSSFVLNNLVGESSYHFLHQLNKACRHLNIVMPVLSCNLTEAELFRIKSTDSIKLLSCGAFFETVDDQFTHRQISRHGTQSFSLFYVCAYNAVYSLAQAYQNRKDDHPACITQFLHSQMIPSVLGKLQFSSLNNHISLPSYIAEAKFGKFKIINKNEKCLPADPYLARTDFSVFHELSKVYLPDGHLRLVK